MSKNHAPSLMRKIRRGLKEGRNPDDLLVNAKSISDYYYRSLSFYLLAPHFSSKSKQYKQVISLASSDIDKVQQPWKRIELIGSISKLLKSFSDSNIRNELYSKILDKVGNERDKDVKEFLLKYSKNFPDIFLNDLLSLSSKLEGSEFETGKIIIRHGVNMKSKLSLIDDLLKFDTKSRAKLLGYLHLQLFKSDRNENSIALSKALETATTQESLLYLVRICSKPSDFILFEKHILDTPAEDKLFLLIALISRSDRKNLSELAKELYDRAEEQYTMLPESGVKNKLRIKLDLTAERLGGIHISAKAKKVKSLSEISDSGKHTLGLYNTYGGNWNHPHFKSIFKASNLCAAFNLDLALINFPEISPERLVKEIKKEMRLPNEGYTKALFDKNRVQFFKKEINENWSGSVVATTANPDTSKSSLPRGRLCMVMGLGPKGLPKSFVNKTSYHFELTGANVAFETGTAMGAISAHLMKS